MVKEKKIEDTGAERCFSLLYSQFLGSREKKEGDWKKKRERKKERKEGRKEGRKKEKERKKVRKKERKERKERKPKTILLNILFWRKVN